MPPMPTKSLNSLKKGDLLLAPDFDIYREPGKKKVTFQSWHTPNLKLWVKDEQGFAELYSISEIQRDQEEPRPKYGYRRTWE